jgi:hypothetical protein
VEKQADVYLVLAITDRKSILVPFSGSEVGDPVMFTSNISPEYVKGICAADGGEYRVVVDCRGYFVLAAQAVDERSASAMIRPFVAELRGRLSQQ